jgi:hypothetical protein
MEDGLELQTGDWILQKHADGLRGVARAHNSSILSSQSGLQSNSFEHEYLSQLLTDRQGPWELPALGDF